MQQAKVQAKSQLALVEQQLLADRAARDAQLRQPTSLVRVSLAPLVDPEPAALHMHALMDTAMQTLPASEPVALRLSWLLHPQRSQSLRIIRILHAASSVALYAWHQNRMLIGRLNCSYMVCFLHKPVQQFHVVLSMGAILATDPAHSQ